MKWKGRRSSDNVNKGGDGGRVPIGRLGGTGLVIALLVTFLLGGNPLDLLVTNMMLPENPQTGPYVSRSEEEAEIEDFLSVVLADTEDVWHQIFRENGMTYREPKLTLYQDRINTACGMGSSRIGPFYCGADETVYIDVAFARELRTIFDAEGDFAFAYVLAHEIGHHVQKQTGVLDQVHRLRGRVSERDYNKYMVMLELQADYYAGVFAHHVENKGYLDPGDLEEGMKAAAGVGDDRIQEMQGMEADPDTFQHGSSKQRMTWFLRGFKYGDMNHGDTFNSRDLQ